MKGKVLQLLKNAQGEWISGEDICRQLDISRTAVWKHIQSLKQDQYEVKTRPRLGYQLVSIPDRLYPWEITPNLNTRFVGQRIIYHHQMLSTNDEAKKIARGSAAEGTIVVTEKQTGGRGRMGRQWHSKTGQDITFSLVLYPFVTPLEAPKFIMLTAVAVAKAIEDTCGLTVDIKWPNDLLLNGRKVCGILVEMGAEMDRVKYIVLGIGVNVNSTAEQWPKEIENQATSLREVCGQKIERLKLLKNMLVCLEEFYSQWQKDGFTPVMAEWRARCVSQHCPARVETIHGRYTGWVEGIDDNGALLLRLDNGQLRRFMSGDVSLRF